ncbi:hypothetical protein Tco_1087966, partial [Tanacetum coccineum]
KSKLLGVNVPDEEVSNMALVLGCGIAMLPMMYLGVLVGCNMRRCDYWKRIVQKFESKMSQWKATLLSAGGHLSLIKAVLASKAMGGLSIGSIFALNIVLLFKWVWRFRTYSNGLWVNVIKGIHGIDGGIRSSRAGKSTHSPWNCIVKLVSKLQAKGIDLLALCSRSVGYGHSISFWKESWRSPRGRAESNQLDELLEAISNVTVSVSVDGWKWELDMSGFTVSSARSHIDEHTLVGSFTSTRWLRCIPIKVNDFIWKLRLDKLPTLAFASF